MRQVFGIVPGRIAVAAALTLAASMLAGTAFAYEHNRSGDMGAMVDHDGIYLAQQIGKCLNHSGPCYFGGQCPGGEYTHNAYANARVYCENFYPPRPYAPNLFESLLGAR
jgi:hypothetical protein